MGSLLVFVSFEKQANDHELATSRTNFLTLNQFVIIGSGRLVHNQADPIMLPHLCGNLVE